MARYDQATRQIMLFDSIANSRLGRSLAELIAALPEDYARHSRTIRRDLEALELHFPVWTTRQNGRTVWKLVEGYRGGVQKLGFSPAELMALVFSRDLLKPLDGTPIKESLDSAFNKAAAALPPEAVAYLQRLRNYFSIGLGPHKNYSQHKETVDRLTRAIDRKRTIEMRYYSASRNRTGLRSVDPYRIWYAAGALYLIGYCHTRRDVRMFAIERIRSLRLTIDPCQMPLHFDIEEYVQNALVVMRGKPIEVELIFDRKTAAWAKDREWHPTQRLEPMKGGRMKMLLSAADTSELTGWILSFGAGVRVAAPAPLRDKVRAEAKKIFDREEELSPDVTSGN
jgi:predicted DNA-binding transcriptional regulator YafY